MRCLVGDQSDIDSFGPTTSPYIVHRLVYFDAHPDMDGAHQRKRQLKGLNRAKKDVLVTSLNPERRDLFDELLPTSSTGL